MHYLSICAIAKDETPYLNEWIAFHKISGIDHIYIYDNGSQIPVKDIVKPYLDEGFVDVIPWPGVAQQMVSYTYHLNTFGNQSQFVAFIDIDEYIVNKTDRSIKDILSDYEKFGGLQISWKLFGSNGHKEKPNGLTIEEFTMASPIWWHENLHCKSICQPSKALCAGDNPHFIRYKLGHHAVSEDFQRVDNAFAKKFCADKLQLNHYVIRSLEEFKIKISKGRADTDKYPAKKLADFNYFDLMCKEKDECAVKFVDSVKEELYRIKDK